MICDGNIRSALLRCRLSFPFETFMSLSLFQPVIADVFACALTFQFAGCHQLTERAFDGTDTEGRTKFPDVLFGEPTDLIHGGAAYRFQSGKFGLYQCSPAVILLIGWTR